MNLRSWGRFSRSGSGNVRCAPSGAGGRRWSLWKEEKGAQQEQVVHFETWGEAPERPQQHRHPVRTGINTLPHPGQWVWILYTLEFVLLPPQLAIAHCSARAHCSRGQVRCPGDASVVTIVAIFSNACFTKANLDGFLPSPYKATSWSFTSLRRTSVSSAVNRSWRAPGKFAIMIAIRHGTSAPAFKGNVRWRSDWFIARYAQTTPMSNVATSAQPILDLCRAQESFIPPATATAPEICSQSYLHFAFKTCVLDCQDRALSLHAGYHVLILTRVKYISNAVLKHFRSESSAYSFNCIDGTQHIPTTH